MASVSIRGIPCWGNPYILLCGPPEAVCWRVRFGRQYSPAPTAMPACRHSTLCQQPIAALAWESPGDRL